MHEAHLYKRAEEEKAISISDMNIFLKVLREQHEVLVQKSKALSENMDNFSRGAMCIVNDEINALECFYRGCLQEFDKFIKVDEHVMNFFDQEELNLVDITQFVDSNDLNDYEESEDEDYEEQGYASEVDKYVSDSD